MTPEEQNAILELLNKLGPNMEQVNSKCIKIVLASGSPQYSISS